MPDPQSTPRDLASYTPGGFDRGASLAKETIWVLVKWIFFQGAFPWPSALRVFWLRLFGAEVGEGVVIRSGVNITFPWRMRIGDHVWIGEEAFILSLAPVTIEGSVCISQRAFLCTGSHDHTKPSFDLKTAPITLRHGSWVAAQAFIGPGVEIGEGSVVAAGTVLMESVAARVLVRGNPGVVVKTLEPPSEFQHPTSNIQHPTSK
jgi:putative colanic acid biosynthesis acetyltransferase WcaF